jgi:hypothetical protein
MCCLRERIGLVGDAGKIWWSVEITRVVKNVRGRILSASPRASCMIGLELLTCISCVFTLLSLLSVLTYYGPLHEYEESADALWQLLHLTGRVIPLLCNVGELRRCWAKVGCPTLGCYSGGATVCPAVKSQTSRCVLDGRRRLHRISSASSQSQSSMISPISFLCNQ